MIFTRHSRAKVFVMHCYYYIDEKKGKNNVPTGVWHFSNDILRMITRMKYK